MKNDQHQQARNLFFETELTQAQIAQFLGISQKTMSLWVNEGKWNYTKDRAQIIPAIIIEELFAELAHINHIIKNREPLLQYATPKEADTRLKILSSIKQIQTQQSVSAHVEVLINFITFLLQHYPDLARPVGDAADIYLKAEKKLESKPYEIPYNLPSFPQSDYDTNTTNDI